MKILFSSFYGKSGEKNLSKLVLQTLRLSQQVGGAKERVPPSADCYLGKFWTCGKWRVQSKLSCFLQSVELGPPGASVVIQEMNTHSEPAPPPLLNSDEEKLLTLLG